MDARLRCMAWMAAPLMAGCAAPQTIDVSRVMRPPESAAELEKRSEAKLALGNNYLAAGETKLGHFLLEEAAVDSELASLKARTARSRALARLGR